MLKQTAVCVVAKWLLVINLEDNTQTPMKIH